MSYIANNRPDLKQFFDRKTCQRVKHHFNVLTSQPEVVQEFVAES